MEKLIPIPAESWASISLSYELYEQWIEGENQRRELMENPTEELKKSAEENGMTVEQLLCPSTHGGSGYASGTRWDDDGNLVCTCGYVMENPWATGGTQEFAPGWRGWFLGRSRTIPNWGWLGTNKKAVEKYFQRYPERAEYR